MFPRSWMFKWVSFLWKSEEKSYMFFWRNDWLQNQSVPAFWWAPHYHVLCTHSFKMFVMFVHWHRCVDASISQVSPFTLHRPHPETPKISQNHPTLSYPSACLTKSYQTSTHFPSQNKMPMPPLPPLATIMDSPTSSAGVKWHRLIVDEMITMS